MILVTGATGHYGNAVINYLLKKEVDPNQLVALVRNEKAVEEFKHKGINAVIGDYDNYPSLAQAFKGIEKILFVSGSDINKRLSQHEHVIQAAKEVGVKHIVYTSFLGKNETESSPLWLVAKSHLQTERWLRESGVDYTILKNNLYLDLIPAFVGEQVLDTGVIYLPAENGKVSAPLRSDLAEAAANILIGKNHKGKTYNLTNLHAFSYEDIAHQISEITGKQIKYVSPTVTEYEQTLSNFGVPNEAIGIFSNFAAAQAQGELETVSTDLEELLGHKPTSINDFLKGVYGGLLVE